MNLDRYPSAQVSVPVVLEEGKAKMVAGVVGMQISSSGGQASASQVPVGPNPKAGKKPFWKRISKFSGKHGNKDLLKTPSQDPSTAGEKKQNKLGPAQDTLQPVSGWWLFRVKEGVDSDDTVERLSRSR
ncbi:hypothetical protein G7Y89_g6636 [Cudoniella acicularis]|uniref:Uncharacterized protein n=1 Tax=Cudoniella acicularis TaxID=354080 RepID=A0A8H4RML7_9HELO|nr:hypothetical protein G7Y89_g6636 [Cudoniella acicularis]